MEEALVARMQLARDVLLHADDRISWYGFSRGETGGRIALQLISAGREYTHDGHDGLDRPRVQFELRGEDGETVTQLARAVIAEMERPADIYDIRFHPAMLEDDRTFDTEELTGGQVLYRRQLDFLFYFEEM